MLTDTGGTLTGTGEITGHDGTRTCKGTFLKVELPRQLRGGGAVVPPAGAAFVFCFATAEDAPTVAGPLQHADPLSLFIISAY
jgi:hypothetical protein